ncbi:unannotated protein [freshwater metagenome]|uniref:Unannotated protein n=1 Tax=freshwater metagenome TaxID=449393 RepID=A0A6J7GKP1_9ZZZZ
MLFDRRFNNTNDVGFDRHVASHDGDLRAQLAAAFCDYFEHLGAASRQNKIGAFFGETFGEALAQTVRSSGNQNCLTCELTHEMIPFQIAGCSAVREQIYSQ